MSEFSANTGNSYGIDLDDDGIYISDDFDENDDEDNYLTYGESARYRNEEVYSSDNESDSTDDDDNENNNDDSDNEIDTIDFLGNIIPGKKGQGKGKGKTLGKTKRRKNNKDISTVSQREQAQDMTELFSAFGVNTNVPAQSFIAKDFTSSSSQPSFSSQPQPSFSSQPQPGFSSQPQPSFSSQPQPGFSSQPQPGFSSQPQPGFSSQPQPSFSSQPQPGFSSQPQPSFSSQPSGGFGSQQAGNKSLWLTSLGFQPRKPAQYPYHKVLWGTGYPLSDKQKVENYTPPPQQAFQPAPSISQQQFSQQPQKKPASKAKKVNGMNKTQYKKMLKERLMQKYATGQATEIAAQLTTLAFDGNVFSEAITQKLYGHAREIGLAQ